MQLLFKKFTEFGDRKAIECEESSLTYNELLSEALKVAEILLEDGASEEPIGIVGTRKTETYVGIIGILFALNAF